MQILECHPFDWPFNQLLSSFWKRLMALFGMSSAIVWKRPGHIMNEPKFPSESKIKGLAFTLLVNSVLLPSSHFFLCLIFCDFRFLHRHFLFVRNHKIYCILIIYSYILTLYTTNNNPGLSSISQPSKSLRAAKPLSTKVWMYGVSPPVQKRLPSWRKRRWNNNEVHWAKGAKYL